MTIHARLLTLCLFLLLLSLAPAAGGRRLQIVVLLERGAAAKSLIQSDDIVLAAPARVGRYTAVRLDVSEQRAAALAESDGVVRVWPWTAPRMHDERSGQIVAGAVDTSGRLTGPGYLAWLDARGLGDLTAPVIDVADSGFDRGSTSDVPVDLEGRVVYARDVTTDADPHDLSGHGTLNASIAAGGATDLVDSGGYAFGLGIAPTARVGSTRIFRNNGAFGVQAFYSAIVAPAWRDGARVTSNSWGSPANFYTIDSSEYDDIVRDADPAEPGNQGMVVVFSSGNQGPNGHVETPGTAKNVITVGAAESLRGGTDGCGVGPTGADSAFDVAFFSGGGPLDDGRVKPDLVAPGTHIAGTRSRADGYKGDGVCAEGFVGDAQRFTWSSGTSHAAPAVSGAAALLYSYLERERGTTPSPALVKAWLLNSTRYLAGAGANDDLPSPRQGWGLLDLDRTFDGAPRVVVDQTERFVTVGQTREYVCAPVDPSRPVRVTLVWTDAAGDAGTAPELNDLDLEVETNGQLYRGNRFARDRSTTGGVADTRNNVEGVWLPAGGGPLRVRVRASSLLEDGVPQTNFDPRDQDFALVVYNAEARPAALLRVASAQIDTADPGGETTARLTIENYGTAASAPVSVTLAAGPGVTVLDGADALPALEPGQSATLDRGFRVSIDESVPCGGSLGLEARFADVAAPVAARAGGVEERVVFEDDVEGEARWTFQTENRGASWVRTDELVHGGAKSWHATGSPVSGDSWILSEPIEIPAGAVDASFVYYQTYAFERGFDGGVAEISAGGKFVDLGSLIVEGAYPLNITSFFGNTLGTRPAWTGGDLGSFRRVTIDLTPFAGKTVRIRLRIGADARQGGPGWYVDDFRLTALVPSCESAGGEAPRITAATYKSGRLKIKGANFSTNATIAINGRTVTAPVVFKPGKNVFRVSAGADVINVKPGLNVVTVTVDGRTSRAFAMVV